MKRAGTEERSPRTLLGELPLLVYKAVLSPVLHAGVGGACRFQPTCSEYAALAVARHGVFRGGWLAALRLSKCHPFHRPDFDPVPETWAAFPRKRPSCASTAAFMQSCVPPFTIKQREFGAGHEGVEPSAAPPLAPTPSYDRR